MKTRKAHWISNFCCGIALIHAAAVAVAQTYPAKPIRVVTAEAGGSSDFAARLIGYGMSAALGQVMVVDNRGGGGVIPGEIVARAKPDGYTLLIYTNNLWVSPMLSGNNSYDPVRQFVPITLAARAPGVLVVHPSLPVSSAKELIELARAKPGEISYASGPFGSNSNLSGALFKHMAHIDMLQVSYKGAGPALIDVMANRANLMFANAASAAPHLKGDKLKALAVSSATPSAILPGLPTIAATGLPGFEVVTILGMWAPAGTSPAIVERLYQEAVRVLSLPATRERFANGGAEVAASSPQELAAAMKAEMARLTRMVKETGLRELQH